MEEGIIVMTIHDYGLFALWINNLICLCFISDKVQNKAFPILSIVWLVCTWIIMGM